MSKVDVVICTKDRYGLLPFAVYQAKDFFPFNRIIVIDSSSHPDLELLARLQVSSVFTPNVPLGAARQKGLLVSETDIVAFIDDDITLETNWYDIMSSALLSEPKAVGASSRVIFGFNCDDSLVKLHSCGMRGEGASAGISLIKRDLALKLGGFNLLIHRSEDAEFEVRIKASGYKWLRVLNAYAYHPLTFKEYIAKAGVNAEGWLVIWSSMKQNLRLRFLAYRSGSALLMPFYYGFLSMDPKVFAYAFLYKWKMLLSFLWKVNKSA